MEQAALYRMIWRWHFYAGLLVMPLILVLSVTGSIYLFKPQIDRWEERAWQGLSEKGAVSPAKQVQAALDAWPSARFDACSSRIFSSTVPFATSRVAITLRVWPIRCARSIACASTAGFHHGSSRYT